MSERVGLAGLGPPYRPRHPKSGDFGYGPHAGRQSLVYFCTLNLCTVIWR